MKKVKATYGFKVVDDDNNIVNYVGGTTWNGLCYKDYEAFKKGEGVCYISEYGLTDLHEQLRVLKRDFIEKNYDEDFYTEDYKYALSLYSWTRKDILNLVCDDYDNKTPEEKAIYDKMAEIVFEGVDWQSPSTYFLEIELEDFAEDLGITPEEIGKYF